MTAFTPDHGAPGILAFPQFGPFGLALHANRLQDVITKMHSDNKYSKMVLYVEACESGSMFNKILAGNLNVYAVTASSPFESSWACYQDKYANTYIGDCFSNHWMENSDSSDWASQTLQAQFNAVHDATNTSTVCAYGDTSIATMTLSQFFGVSGSSRPLAPHRLSALSEPVSSRDVPIKILQRKVETALTSSDAALAQAQLDAELAARAIVDQRFTVIASVLTAGDASAAAQLLAPAPRGSSCTDPSAVSDFACAEHAFNAYAFTCGGFTDYSLKYFKVLRSACASAQMASRINAALKKAC